MKAENLEKAQRLINRIKLMEQALQWHRSMSECALFVNLFKKGKRGELEVGYNNDYYIGLSPKQQDDLADLMKKWLGEDKQELETL